MRRTSPATASGSSEIRDTLRALRPFFVRSAWFSAIAGLLVLMSSWYMLEVYVRVVNSRNTLTLVMLTLVVLAAYALMEVLEWNELLEEARRPAGFARRVVDFVGVVEKRAKTAKTVPLEGAIERLQVGPDRVRREVIDHVAFAAGRRTLD